MIYLTNFDPISEYVKYSKIKDPRAVIFRHPMPPSFEFPNYNYDKAIELGLYSLAYYGTEKEANKFYEDFLWSKQ